ncbi:uncharacterized protein E0L32_008098 [Thyridium curvatum]|uniref:Protein transport protein sec16 n=1 Tax=Thyridium curvatum TaxID=1093900 RepID=A0A507AM65_9PEZI|nr:uncharacterized protein E0L32_008098 [Thyridium curvatum]TPX10892.1 hypothetical protein E0L32_008098 [Thyridium curvatum]
MSSDAPTAAWHPALMPHTAADIVPDKLPSEEAAVPSSSTEANKDDVAYATGPRPEPNDVQGHEHTRNSAGEDWFPEYESASPWLDQPSDQPFPSGETAAEVQAEHHEDDVEDQAFTSSNAAKHASTISFARTVSHDVNFDGDDEDPEWNLPRTDTDPFKFMPPSDRTNSFPVVPPVPQELAKGTDHSLPSTQVEGLINKVEEDAAVLQETTQHAGSAAATTSSRSDQSAGNEAEVQHSMGGDLMGSREEASDERYAEGLPLISRAATANEAPVEHAAQADPFGEADGPEDDDFFNNIGAGEESIPDVAPEPHSLERKSTMQVIDSMNFGKLDRHDTGLDSMAEVAESPNDEAPAPVPAQVETAEQATTVEDAPEGGDLAAKWAAAFASDDDEEDFLLEDTTAESKEIDPAAFFGDDDEGFLDDAEEPATQDQSVASVPRGVASSSGALAGSRYVPSGAAPAPSQAPNPYYPNSAAQMIQPPTPFSYGAPTPAAPPFPGTGPQQADAARPEPSKAQSFVDKSKGGYHSPYDLPMEVVKPRKRQSLQHLSSAPSHPAPPPMAPPPRSSSMQSPTRAFSTTSSPPSSSHGIQHAAGSKPPAEMKKHKESFFEELPMSSRPRPASRHSHTSQPSPALSSPYGNIPPPQGPPHPSQQLQSGHHDTSIISPPPSQQTHSQPPGANIPNLVPPERVSPYAPLQSGSGPQTSMPPAASSTRYSPAPPPLTHAHTTPSAPPSTRYSPAPSSRATSGGYNVAPPPILPHQPRTSSPLAHFEISSDRAARPLHTSHSDSHIEQRRSSSSMYESRLNRVPSLPPTREVDEEDTARQPGADSGPPPPQQAMPYMPRQTPPPQLPNSQATLSPPKRVSSYAPQPQTSYNSQHPEFAPPPRSHTQSPGSLYGNRTGGRQPEPVPRPSSVHDPTSPRSSAPPLFTETVPASSRASRPRGFSQNLNLVPPTDGREHDPLQRWKGCPVISWGVGGTLVTSFPKDVPRYGMNQALPMIIRSPGQVKMKSIKEMEPLEERLNKFPGPLKGKSKKKEVLTWLSAGIETLERSSPSSTFQAYLSHEDKRAAERILLWKVLRLLVEFDGTLDGSPAVEKAVRDVLVPSTGTVDPTAAYQAGVNGGAVTHSSLTQMTPDAVDSPVIEEIRASLLAGDREKAAWDAADKRLWGHALLIASSASPELYKKVTQEFVRKEINYPGHQNESIGALYDILSGNHEECVDELVPVHARAGLQLMATNPTSATSKDSLEGLDKWRETLSLVLSNRSPNDTNALRAMGNLLSGYGRAEAAHICFLFARDVSVFGGLDDPQANFVLVGSDHRRQVDQFAKEIEPLLLSEVYEYGLSLAGGLNAATGNPHLAAYKLQHAITLSEYGFRDKALQYCDAIINSITAQTRRSAYHHAVLEGAVEDLYKRLKQAPKGESNSWIPKPSMNKVSDSMWNRFNKFVAGDEAEGAADGANGEGMESGPFARIPGGTPTISRPASSAGATGMEMFGSQANPYAAAQSSAPAVPPPAPTRAGSRYAPATSAAPAAYEPGSSYTPAGRSSMERSSGEYNRSSYELPRRSGEYSPGYAAPSGAQNGSVPSPGYQQPQQAPQHSPYAPSSQTDLHAQQQAQAEYPGYNADSATNGSPYAPAPAVQVSPAKVEDETPVTTGYQAPSYGYEPPSINTSYEPPSAGTEEKQPEENATGGGYEPPSFQPYGYEPPSYNPEPDAASDDEARPKKPKKSFMDDDDDDIPALKAQPQGKTKEEKDRENAELFRKVAEEDAKRAEAEKAAKAKKGWGLTSWWGGSGKKETSPSPDPNKPIRANLGEKSSFYFDPELKRWVNKNAPPEESAAKKATPPPPRSAPRSATNTPPPPGAGPPPPPPMGGGAGSSLPPSASLPNLAVGAGLPPRSSGSDGSGGAGGPPLGGPVAMLRSGSSGGVGGGGAAATPPPSRPATSMSNASSIDDLLSAAGPRKPGAKKGRKAGRYVDVMAK